MSRLFQVVFIGAILASIVFHELGHFLTARRFGIKVQQFFIGFGPRLWSVRRGETEYGVKALPLGGYVRIAGMNPYEEIPDEDRGRVFRAKRPWQRAIVLAAGSFTHFLVALGIVAGIRATAGEIDFDRPTTVIAGVEEKAAADRAGIRAGDRLLAVDGRPVGSWTQAVDLIRARPGEAVVVEVARAGERVRLAATLARENPRTREKIGYLGIGPRFEVVRRGALASIGRAGQEVGELMKQSVLGIGHLFSPSTLGRLLRQVAGAEPRRAEDPATVVGIARQAGAFAENGGAVALLFVIAGVNVFIGVVNLLPLPPLDGGHLAVLAYERVRAREVDMRRLIPLTTAVIFIFGWLFLLLLWLDIVSPLPQIPG